MAKEAQKSLMSVIDKYNKLKEKFSKKLIGALLILGCLSIVAAGLIYANMMEQGELARKQAQDLLSSAQTTSSPSGTASVRVLEDVQNYSVIAKLTIPKLGLELPVIKDYSEEALTVSVCYYAGPTQPGSAGNMVIVGHDYKSGAHFGRVNELKIGDSVVLMDVWGKEYTYQVYELVQVLPDDTASLNVYEGTSAVTLLTCTDNANKRLLVRCKLVAN